MRRKGSKRGNGTKLCAGERDLEGERAFWDYYIRDYYAIPDSGRLHSGRLHSGILPSGIVRGVSPIRNIK